MAGGLDPSVTDEWLPPLPPGWSLKALRWTSWIRARLGWKGLTAAEYVTEGVPLLSTPDIKTPAINYSGANRVTWDRYEESPEIKLSNGDVLLTKDGATIGIVNLVVDLPEPATVNGSIAVLSPRGELSGRYLRYCLISLYAQQMMTFLQGGMGVPHLFQADIKRMRMPLPPLTEQQVIADYLDRETAVIDELIEKQNALIERLRERRKQVILRAVVYGLNGEDLVDTGNAWIPIMPRSWKLTRIKRVTTKTAGATPESGNPEYWDDEDGTPWVAIGDMSQRRFVEGTAKKVSDEGKRAARLSEGKPGTVLFAMYASVGEVAVLRVAAVWNQALIGLVGNPKEITQTYLYFSLLAMRSRFASMFRSNTQNNLNAEQVGNLDIAIPPIDEQRSITDHLDRETMKIDELIAKVERHIDLAKERRSALITGAVTGQTDVGAL